MPDAVTEPNPTDEHAQRGGRRRDDAREEAILDAAYSLLAEVGYDRLTMDGVAARARASKATIYRRWPGKAELVVDAMHRQSTRIHTPDLGSLREELLAEFRQVAAMAAGTDGRVLCGVAWAAQGDPDLAATFKRAMEAKDTSDLDTVIDRAKARGEITRGSATLLEEVIGPMALLQFLKGEPLDEAFVVHLVDDVALPLLGAEPPGR